MYSITTELTNEKAAGMMIQDGHLKIFVDDAAAREIYQQVEHAYHIEDASCHAIDWLDDYKLTPEDVPCMDEDEWNAVYDKAATRFENCYDCNVAENDMWEAIVDDLLPDVLFKKYIEAVTAPDYTLREIADARDTLKDAQSWSEDQLEYFDTLVYRANERKRDELIQRMSSSFWPPIADIYAALQESHKKCATRS